jgi:hypothetical protein
MFVYTPRDEDEVAVCRSLFRLSYNFSLRERRKSTTAWVPLFGLGRNRNLQEPVPVAQ